MYVHPAFRIGFREALPILQERAFGQLVVPTPEAPVAVHVPFLVEATGPERLRLELHVARANPIHTHVGEGCRCLVICQTDDAYISPDWYGIENQVPTWTYVAVHLTGTVTIMADDRKLDHVDRLSARFESRLAPKPPWTSEKMDPQKRRAMLAAIVGISVEVDVVEAQRKLLQHKTEAARRGAIKGLNGRGDARSLGIAALIEETLGGK